MKVNDPNFSSLTARVDSCRQVSWEETGNPVCPYAARVGSESWIVRINDFPDENLYTLLRDGRETESFDEWPAAWSRPEPARLTSSGGPGDDIHLSELVRSLRSLAVDSPERQARVEEAARTYAEGVYKDAQAQAVQKVIDAVHKALDS